MVRVGPAPLDLSRNDTNRDSIPSSAAAAVYYYYHQTPAPYPRPSSHYCDSSPNGAIGGSTVQWRLTTDPSNTDNLVAPSRVWLSSGATIPPVPYPSSVDNGRGTRSARGTPCANNPAEWREASHRVWRRVNGDRAGVAVGRRG